MRKQFLIVASLALVTAGCAATIQKTEEGAPASVAATSGKGIVLNMTGSTDSTTAKSWSDFKDLWREACAEEATAAGWAFRMQEGDPKPLSSDGILIIVNVVDYHAVSQGSRIMFGAMTGNAFINAEVTFRDLKSGAVRSAKHYDTTSSAWQGVFAGVTNKQVPAMCHEIVGEALRLSGG
jgi:hypothetical protein